MLLRLSPSCIMLVVTMLMASILLPSGATALQPCVHQWTYGTTPGVSTDPDTGALIWEMASVGPRADGIGIFGPELQGDVQISIDYEQFTPGSAEVLAGAQLSGDNYLHKGVAAIRGDLAMFVDINGQNEKVAPALKQSSVRQGRWQFGRSGQSLLVRSITTEKVAEVIVPETFVDAGTVLSFQMVAYVPTSAATTIRITGVTLKGGGYDSIELMHFRMDPVSKALCSYVAGAPPVSTNIDTIMAGSTVALPTCIHSWFHSDLTPSSFITDNGGK
jgi:hypothetical protein